MIEREDTGPVALLRLDHGKVNALDLNLCAELIKSLNEVEQSSVKSVVLTGTGANFSAGVDLFRLLEGGLDYTREFVPVLLQMMVRLFLFPKPVVAALNGNAIAGGCVIACACDYKIAAQGSGRIGVPEVLVGVPFPPIAFEIVRFAANHQHLQEIVYSGLYYEMDEGMQKGLLDETVSPDSLLSRAKEKAAKLSEIPSDTFRLVKRQIREPYLANTERSKIRDEETLNVWCSRQTHSAIREYLRRTLGK